MAKGMYIGIDSIAHKVTKAYVGVTEDSLVVNGDFSNGLEGWTVGSNTSATVNGSLCMTNNAYTGGGHGCTGTLAEDLVINHYYYLCIEGKLPSTVTGSAYALVNWGGSRKSLTLSADDTWHNVSTRFQIATSVTESRLSLIMNAAAEGDVSYWDNIKLYDLTAMYGAGNEPTLAWCDANLETLKTLYKSKNGVARKIKKGYIGVNNVARLFYSAE